MAISFRVGRVTVPTPGTPVALGTGRVLWVMIQGLPANTEHCVVGSAAVRAALASRTGVTIYPAMNTSPPVKIEGGYDHEGGRIDLATLFVDAVVADEGVQWLAAIS